MESSAPAPAGMEPFEFVAQPLSLLLPGSPQEGTPADQKLLNAGKTIEGAAKVFAKSCLGRQSTYENNCAHYLSDALIRAGYNQLAAAHDCVTARCGSPNCGSGGKRPIRANDMRCWFADMAPQAPTSTVERNTGFYVVYQLRPRDGQGHVVILDSDAWKFYGTGWFEVTHPTDTWTHEYFKW